MNIKEAVKFSGLTLKQVEEMTGIPYRSIQNWTSGVRQPPYYVEEYLVKKLCQEKQVARVKVSDDHVAVETLMDGEFELYVYAPIKDGMIPMDVLVTVGNFTNEGYKIIYI